MFLTPILPPSLTALYCTFSAPFKSQDAYNSASNLYTNVVGYTTVDINPGYNMFAVNFKQMGEGQSIKIDDLFPGGGKSDTVFTAGAGVASADYIQVWDNSTGEYSTYFLYKIKKGTNAKDYYWCDDAMNLASDIAFKNGDAFWFYKRGSLAVSANVSGEVELSDVKEVDIKPGYNMIGSFFPAGLTLNDEFYTPTYWQNSGATSGAGVAAADYLQVWDNSKNEYSTYFLYKIKKGTNAKDYKWVDDAMNVADGNVMTPGKGAWYYHRGSGFKLQIKKQF